MTENCFSYFFAGTAGAVLAGTLSNTDPVLVREAWTAKNGVSHAPIRQDHRPFIHHQQSASTTGSITVDGLLRIASTAHSKVNA